MNTQSSELSFDLNTHNYWRSILTKIHTTIGGLFWHGYKFIWGLFWLEYKTIGGLFWLEYTTIGGVFWLEYTQLLEVSFDLNTKLLEVSFDLNTQILLDLLSCLVSYVIWIAQDHLCLKFILILAPLMFSSFPRNSTQTHTVARTHARAQAYASAQRN